MFYFHAELRYWLAHQWDLQATDFIAVPDLASALATFDRTGTLHWLPDTQHIPQLQALRASTQRSTRAPATAPAAPSPEGPPAPRSTRVTVRNLNRDPRYIGDTPLAQRIKAARFDDVIRRHGAPPAPTGGGDRCLTWHLRPNCFANCRRSADHIKLPQAEQDALFTWCKTAFPQE